MPRSAVLATLTLASALAAPAPVSAASPWSPAQTVERAGSGRIALSDQPGATDARGTRWVAWVHARGRAPSVRVAIRRAGARTWSAPITVRTDTRRSIDPPVVALDARGRAVLAWRHWMAGAHRLESRTVTARGELGPLRVLTGPRSSAFSPRFHRAHDDTLLLAWRRGSAAPSWQVARDTGAGLGRPSGLLPIPAYEASFTTTADGGAVAAWSTIGRPFSRVRAARIAADGTLGPVLDVSQEARTARDPVLVRTTTGAATVVFTQSDGSTFRLRAATLAPAAPVFDPAVSLTGADVGAIDPAAVHLTAGETDVVVLTRPAGLVRAGAGAVRLVRLDPAGRPVGTVRRLTGAGEEAVRPVVTRDGARGAIAGWEQVVGPGHHAAWVRALSPGGLGGPPRRLSSPGERVVGLTVTGGPTLQGLAAWTTTTGSAMRVASRSGG